VKRPAVGLTALVLGVTMFASGCAELIDIDKKAVVVGVGVDAAAAPASYQVTIQYLISSGGGGGGGGNVLGGGAPSGSGNQAVTLTAPGRDVADAFRDLRGETDRYMYLGNVGDILIGEGLARRGVLAPLDFFLRAGEVAEATQVVVARGRAFDLLAQKSTTTMGGAAQPLFEFLHLAERAYFPTSPNVLWRFLASDYSRNRSAYAPIFATSTQGQPFKYVGTALFLHGRMVGEIDGYDAIPLDWLIKKNGYPNALVRLPGSGEPVALHVLQVYKRWQVLGPDDVALHLRLNTGVREGNGILLDDKDLAPLEHKAALQIRDQVRRVLDTLQRYGTDVLDLGDRVFARYPRAASDWPATFSRMRLHLDVTVRIYEEGRKT
jgi:spore germination protein KC